VSAGGAKFKHFVEDLEKTVPPLADEATVTVLVFSVFHAPEKF
jgi:hypothetical protein